MRIFNILSKGLDGNLGEKQRVEEEKDLILLSLVYFRFLTKEQIWKLLDNNRSLESTARRVRSLENLNLVFHQGGSAKGALKTKYFYYITKTGYNYISNKLDYTNFPKFVPVSKQGGALREHRIAVMDVVASLVKNIKKVNFKHPITIKNLLLDHKMDGENRETTDYFFHQNKKITITPDFILVLQIGTIGHYLCIGEVDRGTESILNLTPKKTSDSALDQKFQRLDAYIKSRAIYKKLGNEYNFLNEDPTVLFITTTERRIQSIKRRLAYKNELKTGSKENEFDNLYLYTTLENSNHNPFRKVWVNRNINNNYLLDLID